MGCTGPLAVSVFRQIRAWRRRLYNQAREFVWMRGAFSMLRQFQVGGALLVLVPWAEDVARITQGRVALGFSVAPLGSYRRNFDMAWAGLVDIAGGNQSSTPGRFVVTQVNETPFLASSDVEALSRTCSMRTITRAWTASRIRARWRRPAASSSTSPGRWRRTSRRTSVYPCPPLWGLCRHTAFAWPN